MEDDFISPPPQKKIQSQEAGAFASSSKAAASHEQEILDFIENIDDSQFVESVQDDKQVKKMILRFERCISKNQEMRVKYAESPEKFEESELDLIIELKRMSNLVSDPRWLPVLIDLNVASSLINLVAHENSDISIATLVLVNELLDEDNFDDDDDDESDGDEKVNDEKDNAANLKRFNAELLDLGFASVLVDNFARFKEFEADSDEKQGIFMSLSIIENMTSIDSGATGKIVTNTSLIPWLINRLKHPENDTNKLYAMELLSIFLQSPAEDGAKCKEMALEKSFIPTILVLLSQFRKKDPEDVEEIELFENAFVALCSVLFEEKGKIQFREEEGFELMLMMIK